MLVAYDPERMRRTILLVNVNEFAHRPAFCRFDRSCEMNSPQFGALEREVPRVKNGRYLI